MLKRNLAMLYHVVIYICNVKSRAMIDATLCSLAHKDLSHMCNTVTLRCSRKPLTLVHWYELGLNKQFSSRGNVQKASAMFGLDIQADVKGPWDARAMWRDDQSLHTPSKLHKYI